MHIDSKDQLEILVARLFHPARSPGSRGSGACSKSSALSLEGLDEQKVGRKTMNKTLGAHASQFGLS